ncbi:MAG TPA: DUF58 domain-containing protein [Acidimicrobiales bacterium]|nr:DUF58 domain-containing protein [Acidimicrobiales bacterium]
MNRRALLLALDRVKDNLAVAAVRRLAAEALRRSGLTRSGQVAVVSAAIPWLVAYLVAGTALYLFSYATVLVVVAAFFLAPRRLRLTAERTGLFPRVQSGDRLQVDLTLAAERRVGAFILDERVPPALGATVRVPVSGIGRGDTVSHSYSLTCQRRGAYTIGPLVAVAGDPIGLTQRETVLGEPFELLVHPQVVRVADRPLTRQYEDPPMRPPISKPWPSGMDLYGMREFRPGDNIRRIVWRATARTGKLMIWEAEQGITDKVLMVLDTDRGHHSRDGEWSESFETAVQVVASLGVAHLTDGYEVRCETNDGPLIRPLRGLTATLGMLDALARVQMGRGQLTHVLRRLVADPHRDTHYVLVTPRLTATDAAQLKFVLDSGVSVAVIALLWDPEDSDTMGRAASLGCQVIGVRPGDDLARALSGRGVGAGVAMGVGT